MSVRIRIAGVVDHEKWDSFVLSHEEAGPYHLYAWKSAIESAYGHKPYYLIAENDNGEFQGVLPLIHVKAPFLKGSLVSLPFCDYSGIIALNDVARGGLISAAIELAVGLTVRLEIRLKVQEPILQSTYELGIFSHKVRMVLDLPASSKTLWNSFKSKLRSQIKKPQKDGLEFTIGSIELLDDFYSIFSKNMKHLGSPVHSKAWISGIMGSFGKDAHIGVVHLGNMPVGAGIILCCRDTVSIPWASTLWDYNKLSPNMLLYWGFLEYACDNGFKYFDFGRSTPGEGTYKFKEQWGAVPFPLYWYGDGFSNKSGHYNTARNIRSLVENVWSRMPQKFADTLGPMVRKYITL